MKKPADIVHPDIYISKYFMGKGIVHFKNVPQRYEEFRPGSYDLSDMIAVNGSAVPTPFFFGKGSEWHTSLEEAQRHAEEKLDHQIELAEKQLQKLIRLRAKGFKVVSFDHEPIRLGTTAPTGEPW